MKPIIACMIMIAAAAGCLDSGDDPGPDPVPPEDPGDEPVVTERPPPVTQQGTLWTELPWQFGDCQEAVGTVYYTYPYVEEHLPPRFEPAGGALNSLTLLAMSCTSASIGNDTLIEPFQMAVVYTVVNKVNDTSERMEMFVFEVVASNADVVAALDAYGWNAMPGTVHLEAGAPEFLTVEGEGLHYSAAIVSDSIFPEDGHSTHYFWHGNGETEANAVIDFQIGPETGALDYGLLTAEGGVLGAASEGVPTVFICEVLDVSARLIFV